MSTALSPLLAPMLSSAAMRAICDDVACLQNMLDFEAALARAEAAAGIIPDRATGPIAAGCKANAFDLAALGGVAADMGPGQPQRFAQKLDQQGTRVDIRVNGVAVHDH